MATHKIKKFYDEDGNLIVKPYRLLDLAQIFDVNYRTFKRWVSNIEKEMGKPDGKYYSIKQVEYMIAQFGLPRKLNTAVAEETLRNAA
ncbi:MAG: hypothetical protein GXC78_05535 [Chitinophagaceae bacterium]|jgi:hypothetical protein|nr:hypothetical protein [Chitinophagaceae bacterium]